MRVHCGVDARAWMSCNSTRTHTVARCSCVRSVLVAHSNAQIHSYALGKQCRYSPTPTLRAAMRNAAQEDSAGQGCRHERVRRGRHGASAKPSSCCSRGPAVRSAARCLVPAIASAPAGRLRRRRVGRLVRVRRRHRPERAHSRDRHAALVERPRVPGAGRRNGLRGRVRSGWVGAVGRVLGIVWRRPAHAAASGGSPGEARRREVRKHGGGRHVQRCSLREKGAYAPL